MTPEELQLIKNVGFNAAKQNIDRMAENHVLIEVLAELLNQTSGQDAVALRAEIRERIRARQEQYLLKIEDWNATLAAWMDKDTPTSPPADSKG